MPDNSKKKILILACARYKGGLSGSDAIYESFKKYWDHTFCEYNLSDTDFKPFGLCYLWRILLSCIMAITEPNRFSLVYSSSDFLPDTLAGFIFKLRGNKWVAGYYLQAFRENRMHYYTQRLAKFLIDRFADMVIVTNPTMYPLFPDKKKTWINGGIDLSLAGLSDQPKIYDAVFCGRIHPTKGIDELIDIWKLVRDKKPTARLALIGDGDLGLDYVRHRIKSKFGLKDNGGIDLLGYMGNERYEIYKQSKVVLYPTPLKYDHFSMAPVEAMACGCPMIAFNNPVNKEIGKDELFYAEDINDFSECVLEILSGIPRTHETENELAYNFAFGFDYKKQSLLVLKDIEREL